MNPFVTSRGCHVFESNSSSENDEDAFQGERTFTYTQSNTYVSFFEIKIFSILSHTTINHTHTMTLSLSLSLSLTDSHTLTHTHTGGTIRKYFSRIHTLTFLFQYTCSYYTYMYELSISPVTHSHNALHSRFSYYTYV